MVFLSCIAVLFGLAKAMQWVTGDRRRLGDALDLDFSGLGGQLARFRTIVPSRALVGVALMTAALAAAWTFLPRPPAEVVTRDPYAAFPMRLGDWSGTTATLAPNVAETLGADDYVSAFYRAPGETEGIDLFLSYYRDQTNGNAIHTPAGLPARGRLGGRGDPPHPDRAPRHEHRCRPGQPGGDPEGARQAARLLLVRGPRPAHDRRLCRQVLRHGRQHDPRPHRRRAGAADHPVGRAARRRPTPGCSASSPPASTGSTASCPIEPAR